MKRQQAGMVLLTTIMLIVIITMLILTLMQGILLYIKSNKQIVSNHQSFYQMEAFAHKLNLNSSACTVHNKNSNQLITILQTHQGCTLVDGSYQYTYILGDMGSFPCLQIQVGDTWYGSRHVLVTIATRQQHEQLLQFHFALPAKTSICQSSALHRIHQGVVSWRNPKIKYTNGVK